MDNPRTVEDVIKDFKGRRAGILKALTKDVEKFYQLCDPNHPSLCLYGFPNQQWEVNLPPFSDLPEPRLGINLVRDATTKHEWLSMVALHSDAWLSAIASYFASKFRFDKADKKRLFNKITDVASISKVFEMQGKARKRATKAEGGGLPVEILEEILSRLPVRDLLKYRSVCKIWMSLIDDPDFVSTHLKKYPNNSEESHLLVIYSPKRWLHEEVFIRRGDTYRKVTKLKTLFDHDHEGADYLSYVNGIFLVKKRNSRIIREIELLLWNPSINRILNLSDSVFHILKNSTYFELGLGYDACCGDYKVIAIVYPHAELQYNCGNNHYRATIPGLVRVYKLSTHSWSSNLGVSPPPYWHKGRQVFTNGAIHWMNIGPNVADDVWYKKEDSYVVAFDVENEVFKYFELPICMKSGDDNKPQEKFPTVLGGSLAIFCTHLECRYDIWVMKEYGVPDSWSKCYTFTLFCDELLHFNNNGELLFAVDGKGIKSYDVKREKVRDLAKTYSRSSKYTVHTYVESLILSQEFDNRPFKSGLYYKDNTPVSGSELSLVTTGQCSYGGN